MNKQGGYPGELTMLPSQLFGGGGELTRAADGLAGHARVVADLTGLRAAFAGAGEAGWPAVEAQLTELMSRIEAAASRTTHAGGVVRVAADGSTEIDRVGGNAITM